jgi:alcohol dehydrogenase
VSLADVALDIPLHDRILYGTGRVAELPQIVREHGGRHAFVVTDPGVAAAGIAERVRTLLEEVGIAAHVYAEVEPNPGTASVLRGSHALALLGSAQTVVVALGGGSSMDSAKAISLHATNGGDVLALGYHREDLVPGLAVIAVPTTAGTGSEVTPVAVVSDPHREMKVGISSPHLVPTTAIVDPEFTLGAPRSVTAFAGIDALVHAVESFTAVQGDLAWDTALPVFTGRNAFSDVLALHAVELLGTSLAVAVDDPGNRRAREEVALGSLLAGISFGATGTHLSHALQYPIGAATKTPHGLGTGMLLPYVLHACLDDADVVERIAEVGVALGSAASTADARARDAISSIAALNRAIGVPASLQEIGVTRQQLPRLAELASRSARLVAIAPIPAPPDVLLDILDHAYTGRLTERSDS